MLSGIKPGSNHPQRDVSHPKDLASCLSFQVPEPSLSGRSLGNSLKSLKAQEPGGCSRAGLCVSREQGNEGKRCGAKETGTTWHLATEKAEPRLDFGDLLI